MNPIQASQNTDDTASNGPLQVTEAAKLNSSIPSSDLSPDWVFVSSDIDGTRWNKSYPFQLLMVERVGDGYGNPVATFTLPIPPQDLSITTPFAITTSVTMGGIVEEHNGAPIRIINASGTTGVTPLRGSAQTLRRSGVTESVFAGTISAANNTLSAFKSLLSQNQVNENLVQDNDTDVSLGTGYYQFRLLQRFLESYANLKKNGRTSLRLAFAIWKDQSVYLVTPATFDVRRNAQSPWEYNYVFQLRAWKRIVLGTGAPAFTGFKPVTTDPNAFAQLMTKVQNARRVLQGAGDVLRGFSGDVDATLFEPLRQVLLFAKDGLGVAVTAADLPVSLTRSLKDFVLEVASFTNSLVDIDQTFDSRLTEAQNNIQTLAVLSSKTEARAGATRLTESALSGASEANKIFENPAENFEIMEQIKISDLNLPPQLQARIAEETERVRSMTRLDFEKARDQLVEFSASFADAVGAGDEVYDSTFSRAASNSMRSPSQYDYSVMFALNQAILELNKLAAVSDVDRNQVSTLETVAGMARASGIAFTVPVSKFAVPFPYGSTLEQLSARYLGTPDRWHEIVALNGLRQPYVDEEGFDLKLLVNGHGNQVNVSDVSNLYVGQSVWLSASNTNRTKRRITRIDKVSTAFAIVTVDGDSDLNRYITNAEATLHAFLPDTVNSQMLIYIPSSIEITEDGFRTKSIPGLDEFDRLLSVGGVDLLLTQDGDLVITPDGDCRLAVGMTNLIQRARIAIGTPKGSLIRHPEFGLGAIVGASTADTEPKKMVTALQDMFRQDPSFTGVTGVNISKTGPVLRISMNLNVTGTNQVIPISLEVKR